MPSQSFRPESSGVPQSRPARRSAGGSGEQRHGWAGKSACRAPAESDASEEMQMEFRKVLALRGPNIWANFPVLEAWVDLGEYNDYSSEEVPGFNDRLMVWLPSLIEHRCSVGERGGWSAGPIRGRRKVADQGPARSSPGPSHRVPDETARRAATWREAPCRFAWFRSRMNGPTRLRGEGFMRESLPFQNTIIGTRALFSESDAVWRTKSAPIFPLGQLAQELPTETSHVE